MIDRTVKIRLLGGVFVAVILLAQSSILAAQTQAVKGKEDSPSVHCAMSTERQSWSPGKTAILHISVESLSDGLLEIPLWSDVTLAPVSPNDSPLTGLKDAGRLMAAVDPVVFDPLGLSSTAVVRDVKGDGSIRLRFAHKGDKTNFKFDARDLVWDFEAVSRTPALKLFSAAKPGAYDLQFHMWWSTGACESAKVRLTIGQSNRRNEK